MQSETQINFTCKIVGLLEVIEEYVDLCVCKRCRDFPLCKTEYLKNLLRVKWAVHVWDKRQLTLHI